MLSSFKLVHIFLRLENVRQSNLYFFFRENCVPKAAKVFRWFTKRPYFLPAMAELSKANQLVVAKGEFEDSFMVR